MKSDPTRILLADDHAVVRKGIREFLEEDPGLRVVAEATNGQEAIEFYRRDLPDVGVFDLQMPHMGGLDALRQIKEQFPEARVLILTAFEDEPYVFAALKAGASGYLLKTASSDELVHAVRAVAEGETALSPAIARKLVLRATGRESHGDIIEPLTERELEVLRLASQGLGNKQIGAALGISDRTVQGHLANIYGKLRVATRTEAVMYALREKWITLD